MRFRKRAWQGCTEVHTPPLQGAGGASLWSNWDSTSLRWRLPVRMGFTGLSWRACSAGEQQGAQCRWAPNNGLGRA